jgi:hypothetical protein
VSQELSDAEWLRWFASALTDHGRGSWDESEEARLRSIAAKLERQAIEIDVLRTSGNKDCTAMADERLPVKKARRVACLSKSPCAISPLRDPDGQD